MLQLWTIGIRFLDPTCLVSVYTDSVHSLCDWQAADATIARLVRTLMNTDSPLSERDKENVVTATSAELWMTAASASQLVTAATRRKGDRRNLMLRMKLVEEYVEHIRIVGAAWGRAQSDRLMQ